MQTRKTPLKRSSSHRTGKKSASGIKLFGLFIFIIVAFGIGMYISWHKKSMKEARENKGISYLLPPWMSKNDANNTELTLIQKNISTENNTAEADTSTANQAPISFEFYHTLASTKEKPMIIKSTDFIEKKEEHIASETADETLPITSHMKKKISAHPSRALPLNQSIVNVNDLEKDFYNHLHSIAYILELAHFASRKQALHYEKELRTRGLLPRLTPIQISSHKQYSLQLGPFKNYQQVALMQKRLKALHINGTLKKINLYKG